MQDTPDTPDERLQRRRARRWKRRARILGPFLAVPLLLAALSLSVDLVEYQPHEESDRLSDRPIQMTRQPAPKPVMRPSLSPTIPTDSPTIGSPAKDTSPEMGDAEGIQGDGADLDVMLPASSLLRPPTPPYALGRP